MAKITTLCYLRREGQILMLYRNKKQQDENEGKWIGVGGKLEQGESPSACVVREVREETGLRLTDYRYKGIIRFRSDRWPEEYMVLYEGAGFTGEIREICDEGELRWIPETQVMELPMWEGDRLFLQELLEGRKEINWALTYEGDRLASSERMTGAAALRRNLIDQIQEAQLKLGYAEETLRFYYPVDSLSALMGTSFADAQEAADILEAEPTVQLTDLGPISCSVHGGRIEVTLQPEAAKLVFEQEPPSEFLRELIQLFSSHHDASIREIQDLFASFGQVRLLQMPEGSDFDCALSFADERVDPFVYCIKQEMGHTIYHRFTRRDYEILTETS